MLELLAERELEPAIARVGLKLQLQAPPGLQLHRPSGVQLHGRQGCGCAAIA
jgi:hypothetical protein